MTDSHPIERWEIRHVDLAQPLSALHCPPDARGLCLVVWYGVLPLGSTYLHASELPLTSRALTDLAISLVAPAVGWHLELAGFEHRLRPGDDVPHAQASSDLREVLTASDPLGALRRMVDQAGGDPQRDPQLSVVVCTRGRAALLARCLASLERLVVQPLEVIVVDNSPVPDEAVRTATESLAGGRYVWEPRPGLSAARNAGIRHARGTFVAFTDDDVEVHPCWTARITRSFRDPNVHAVTGLVLPSRIESQAQYHFEAVLSPFPRAFQGRRFDTAFFEALAARGVPAWPIGAGANMAFRRDVFERLGGFDERLGAGAAGCSEDSELWYRILRTGGTCSYDPAAVVFHEHRPELSGLRTQMRAYMRGHVVALLVQAARHRDRGNFRRLLVSLPLHYVKRFTLAVARGMRSDPTVTDEIAGALAGVPYYLRTRRLTPWPALRSDS